MDPRSSYDRIAEETAMKTMIIAIETNGNRNVVELEVPAREWNKKMKQVGQQLNGKKFSSVVVIDGVDVYNYTNGEVAELFGQEG
jgi:hypothetical protein